MTVNIMLVLMVKNESKILLRCLESAFYMVDAILVSDTGSTDDTIEIARAYTKPIEVVHETWCNFCVNRTLSLHSARAYAVRLGWCLDHTYALVLDADMTLQGSHERLRSLLKDRPKGVQLLQKGGNLEYANTRLMLLSDPWVCEGVTHEYWTGNQGAVICAERDVWIDDIGDGGAKADKFERDERLLLEGLKEKPTCERYMFYLAQTYHCLNRHGEAIQWYQKRIEAGGWKEEVWYSHYMIAIHLLVLGKHMEAEDVVQRGALVQPERVEAYLLLIKHFRENSQPFKAWHYLLAAEKQTPCGARLFLETDILQRLAQERCVLAPMIQA
jgi:glycosyltransferase involved in cell wall biosynthesis